MSSSHPVRWPSLAAGFLALTLTLGGCASSPLPKPGQLLMRDVSFPLRDLRMVSGLRVVVEHDARSPMVAVVAVVGAGGTSDPGGKEGLAHLVEHLSFRARPTGGASVEAQLEAAGAGSANAGTGLDFTTYQSLAPKETLATLVKLEGQRLSAPLAGVSPEVFAVEREVVRNELRQLNETGYVGQVSSWVHAAAFPPGDPYARPLIGSHQTLSALTLADAQGFARTHYRPENVTLVISGDVDLAEVESIILRNLPADWVGTVAPPAQPPRLPARPTLPVAGPPAKKLQVYEAAVPTPELYLSWVLPRGFDEASAVHDFVKAALDSNLGRTMLRDEDVAGTAVRLTSGIRASLLTVRVKLTRGDHPERTAQRVIDVVRVAHVDVNSERRQVVTGMLLESEDLLARASRRALLTHFTLDVRAYSRAQQAMAGLNGSWLVNFSYEWLQRDKARIILVRPGENGSSLPAVALAKLPEDDTRRAPVHRVAPSMLTATTGPVQVLKLDNGMEVLLAPRPGLPVVRVSAALGGGTAYGTKPGVGALAAQGAFRGEHGEGHLSDWGLHGGASIGLDHMRVNLAGAAAHVGNMLAILAEDLSSTRTSGDVVRFLREQVLPRREVVDAHPQVVAQRKLMQALYGTHPYGREATGAQMAQVSDSEAESWLEDVYRPPNTVVVVVGEFDVKEVEPLVRTYLGGWKREQDRPAPVEVPPTPALPAASPRPGTLFTSRPGSTQGQVQLACRLPPATPELEAQYALMAELLEVKANQRTRSRAGSTYGFGASTFIARGGAAHLVVTGTLDAQRLEEGAVVLRSTLAEFTKDVSDVDLEQARSRLLAKQAVSFITTEAWVDALLTARVRGFPVEAVAGRPAHLQAVTVEALKQAFDGCAQRLVVGITGDEAPSRAALQAVSVP